MMHVTSDCNVGGQKFVLEAELRHFSGQELMVCGEQESSFGHDHGECNIDAIDPFVIREYRMARPLQPSYFGSTVRRWPPY